MNVLGGGWRTCYKFAKKLALNRAWVWQDALCCYQHHICKQCRQKSNVNLYLWRGVCERLRASGLLEAERDDDLWRRGDGLCLTLVGREGTDWAGVPVFDPAGDFIWDVGSGMDITSWSESDPAVHSAFLLTSDLSGVCEWLRFASTEPRPALEEASESCDIGHCCLFSWPPSEDDEWSRLLLLTALFFDEADDEDEL